MQKIIFEDTVVVKEPYITIDGIEHELQDGEYQGGTDLNAQTFNTMQTNIENAINGVVETGSNANGRWTKFVDGTLIQQGQVSVTSAIGTAMGGVYRTADAVPKNLAVTFYDDTYSLILTPKAAINSAYYVEKNAGNFTCYAIAYTSLSAANRYIDYVAIGRWK